MTTTSEKILHEQFHAVWRGLGEVEQQVGEEAILDEVLTHLDLKDPPLPLRPAAAVLQAIEDEIQPGGARAWPGRKLSAERRHELANQRDQTYVCVRQYADAYEDQHQPA